MAKVPRAVLPAFVVSLGKSAAGIEQWLGSDGEPVEQDKAQRFRLHRSVTLGERARADMIAHEIAGGLDEWLDLQKGLDGVRTRLRATVEASLWPDGRPEVKTPEDVKTQETAFMEAWASNDSTDRALFQSLQGMNDRIEFMARWEVTCTDDVPTAWRRLAEREMAIDAFYALWAAYNETTAGVVAGK